MRRGFTLIEMMLASSIASVVVLTSVGLMRYTERMDARLASRAEDAAAFGRARETLRRAMATLLAAPDPPEDATPADARRPSRARRDEEPEPRRLFALAPTLENDRGPNAPKKLEVWLKRSPISGERVPAPMVFGAFELVPYALDPYFSEQGSVSWALLWTPLMPPGETVVLASALEFAAWEALDDRMAWNPEHAAREVGDFPRSLHVELVAWSGARADWLFEPVIEVREGMP